MDMWLADRVRLAPGSPKLEATKFASWCSQCLIFEKNLNFVRTCLLFEILREINGLRETVEIEGEKEGLGIPQMGDT